MPDLPEPSEHQKAADELAAKVLQRAEAGGYAVSSLVRRDALALMRRLVKKGISPHQILDEFLREFRAILRKYEPLLERTTTDAQLAAYLEGGHGVLRSLPPVNPDALESILDRLRPGHSIEPPEWTKRVTMIGEAEPVSSFPIIDAAAADLTAHGVLTSPDLYELQQNARMQGFDLSRKTMLDGYEKVRDALIDAVLNGDSEKHFRARVGDALETCRLSQSKQQMIFRNVVMRAYARGQKAIVESPLVRSVAVFGFRTEIDDSRLTDLCRALSHSGLEDVNGKRTSIYLVEDPVFRIVAPTSHVGCFVPGTEVQGRFSRGFRLWYDGQTVEITTRSGKRLTVTPNHPILTMNGFASAGSLRQDDNLLSYEGGIENGLDPDRLRETTDRGSRPNDSGRPLVDEHEHYAPTTIEQVFGTLQHSFGSPAWRSPRSADDFHGDAQFGHGDIEIVDADRPLLLHGNTFGSQSIDNLTLSAINLPEPIVPSLRRTDELVSRDFFPSRGIPGGGALSLDAGAVQLERRPLQFLRFGPASGLDASRYNSLDDRGPVYAKGLTKGKHGLAGKVTLNQRLDGDFDAAKGFRFESASPMHPGSNEESSDGRIADASFASDLCRRFPGVVALDEIVQIRYHNFRGHVYDLQSPQGWIISNGIFASNCRCGMIYLTVKRAAEKGIAVAIKWMQTGIRPSDEELFVPLPDLSMVPASERKQFENWQSPWAQEATIRLSAKDAHGHLHKGKGKGGGQFAGPGASQGTPAQKLLGKIMSGEVFSSASMASAFEGTVNERYDALRQVAADLGAIHAPDARMAALFDAIKSHLIQIGREPRHPGWHKAATLIQRFKKQYADGGGTPQEMTDTVNFAANIASTLSIEQRRHVARELGFTGNLEPSDGRGLVSGLGYVGETPNGPAFRDGDGEGMVRKAGGSFTWIEGIEDLKFDPPSVDRSIPNIAEGVRAGLGNAKAEQESRSRAEQEERERPAREAREREERERRAEQDRQQEELRRQQQAREEQARREREAARAAALAEQQRIDRAVDQGSIDRTGDLATWDFYDDEGHQFAQSVYLYSADCDLESPEDKTISSTAREILRNQWHLDEQDINELVEKGPESALWEDCDLGDYRGIDHASKELYALHPPSRVFRWESYQDDGGPTDRGEWVFEEDAARKAGKEFASENNQTKPTRRDEDEDDDDEDSDEDADSDEDIDEIFGATKLGLSVSRSGNDIVIRHPKIKACERTLGVDRKGRKFISNDLFKVHEKDQDDGFGTRVLAAEVEGAAAAGYDYIKTHAASGGYNGYYAWVSLGYDADLSSLSASLAKSIREIVPDAESVLDLMDAGELDLDEDATSELREKLQGMGKHGQKRIKEVFTGADWWFAHGEALPNAKFDLSAGSRSRRRLAKALAKKR